MRGISCPHCGKMAVAWWRKFFYNPLSDGICRACGKSFRLPWGEAAAVYIPCALVFLLGFVMSDVYVWTQLMAAAFVISAVIHVIWVPLVKDD